MPESREQPAVVAGLNGGLGNQMFQYAAARALSLRLNTAVLLDLEWFAGRKDRQYALAPFCIAGRPARGLPLPPALRRRLARMQCKWAGQRMGVPIVRERHFHFDAQLQQLQAPAYLEGYWQSERYFREQAQALRQEFTLRSPAPASCQAVLEHIARKDSICVHIRRGDYVSNPQAAQVHGVCGLDYYQRGLQRLIKGLPAPQAFVFSDDPDWVRENLRLPIASTVVDVNGPLDAHLDLHLMAACDHFIIANSSLSWWGAWLGRHPGKQVVAPQTWFRDGSRDARDLLPADWLRL